MPFSTRRDAPRPSQDESSEIPPLLELLERAGHIRMFDASPYPAIIYNHRRIIVYLNGAAEQWYGYSRRELVGVTPKLLLGRPLARNLTREIAGVLYGDQTVWRGLLPQVTRAGAQSERYVCVVPLRPVRRLHPVAYACVYCGPGEEAKMLASLVDVLLNATFEAGIESGPAVPLPATRRLSRQDEIIRMLALDYSAKEIASIMNLSESTVRVVHWKHRRAQREVQERSAAG